MEVTIKDRSNCVPPPPTATKTRARAMTLEYSKLTDSKEYCIKKDLMGRENIKVMYFFIIHLSILRRKALHAW